MTARLPKKRPARSRPTKKRPPRRTPAKKKRPPAPLVNAPHVELALQYARGVISGDIVAGRLTVLACQRMLRDLERTDTDAFPYVFDLERAEKPCRFIERLPHIKGPKAREGAMLQLGPWQCFAVVNIFGWVHQGTGCRRFRKAFIEVARGNGKSFLASAIALYLLIADGEPGAEVYSAATTRDQAKIVWSVAREIVRQSKGLRKLGLEALAHSIVHHASASTFIPLAAEDSNLDGLNPHGEIIDELHAHTTRGVYDVLETALGKRDQSLMFIITTAGTDRTGICYEVLEYVSDVLSGKYDDEAIFGLIYTIDDGDDWKDETVWLKANPNLGVSIDIAILRDDARKAERIPAAQAAFKTKRLDVWVSANLALFDFEAFVKLGKKGLQESEFEGKKCMVSLDLASKNDFAVRVDVFFRRTDEGKLFITVFAHHYTNEAYVASGKHPQLPGWVSEGWLNVAPGNQNDLHLVRDELLDDATRFELVEVGLDMIQGVGLSQDFTQVGLPVVAIPQIVKQMSEATKKLEELIRTAHLEHDGDPVLCWEIGNVVGHYDVKENVYPRKDRPDKKIDGAVALIMALSRIIVMIDEWASVYETRGVITL